MSGYHLLRPNAHHDSAKTVFYSALWIPVLALTGCPSPDKLTFEDNKLVFRGDGEVVRYPVLFLQGGSDAEKSQGVPGIKFRNYAKKISVKGGKETDVSELSADLGDGKTAVFVMFKPVKVKRVTEGNVTKWTIVP